VPAAQVLIVEDDQFTRTMLSSALAAVGIAAVGSTDNAKDAIELVKQLNPDVVLLDLDLGPGANGLDIAIKLRELTPNLGIVFLTSYSDPRFVTENPVELPIGARYIQKHEIADLKQLQIMILQAKYKPLLSQPQRAKSAVELTDKQLTILKLVASGLTTAEIAAELKLSERAVEKTLTKLQDQLGIAKSNKFNPRVLLTRAFLQISGPKQ
jgi:DNA-binding NarL/FixJ family response regulator